MARGPLLVGQTQFFDDDGNPLGNGTIEAFIAGSVVVRKDTFSDALLTTPNDNPIELNASGRATVFLEAGVYDFYVKDSTGATIYSILGYEGRPGSAWTVLTKSVDYTILGSDGSPLIVLVDAIAGARLITLPAAASSAGTRIVVKKTDTSTWGVTLDGNGAELIDGQTSWKLSSQHQWVELVSDGAAWQIVSRGGKRVVVITADYTAGYDDDVIMCGAGTYLVTLPSAVGRMGHTVTIIRTAAVQADVVSITPPGVETIDGIEVRTLRNAGTFLTVVSGGSNYYVQARGVVQVATVTGAYAAKEDDDIIIANGTFTVTLPTITDKNIGKRIEVKNTGTGVITVAGAGVQTIDGQATQSIDTQYFSLSFVAQWAEWAIV